MQVTVLYRTQLRRLAGIASEAVELPPSVTVDDLLRELTRRHESLAPLLLDAEGRMHGSLLAFVDEEQCRGDHPLADDAEVTLLTPMAGG